MLSVRPYQRRALDSIEQAEKDEATEPAKA